MNYKEQVESNRLNVSNQINMLTINTKLAEYINRAEKLKPLIDDKDSRSEFQVKTRDDYLKSIRIFFSFLLI